MDDKSILRTQARSRRKAIAAAKPEASSGLVAYGSCLSAYRIIAVYRAIGSELDPGPLARSLLVKGISLCLPVVEARSAPMIFRHWHPDDPLARDGAGCLAPLSKALRADPDLILTPLLAFDRAGTRLGQGGGYYDRTFEARPHIARIGLAYADQEVDWLPSERHDRSLQGVLTEKGYRAFVPSP